MPSSLRSSREGSSATTQQDVGGASAAVARLGRGEGEDAALEARVAEPVGKGVSQNRLVHGTQPPSVYDQHAPLAAANRLDDLALQGVPCGAGTEPVEIDAAFGSNSTVAQAPKLTRLDPGGDAERPVLGIGKFEAGGSTDWWPSGRAPRCMTFNPGWEGLGRPANAFTDVWELSASLAASGLVTTEDTTAETPTGPASFKVTDPDGNVILIDQHV